MKIKPNLKNYTTSISAEKSIQEIEKMLLDFGAVDFMKSAKNGYYISLSFLIEDGDKKLPFKMPVNIKAISDYLFTQKTRTSERDIYEKAYRIGWRILKDWIHAQLSIIASGMVTIDEILMPYRLIDNNITLAEAYKSEKYKNKLLPLPEQKIGKELGD